MTTSGHNKTMRQVRIAELKSKLSEFIHVVQRGETISVLHRETPVAQIIPVREKATLQIRKPVTGKPPHRVPLPKPLGNSIDIVNLLLEERQNHR